MDIVLNTNLTTGWKESESPLQSTVLRIFHLWPDHKIHMQPKSYDVKGMPWNKVKTDILLKLQLLLEKEVHLVDLRDCIMKCILCIYCRFLYNACTRCSVCLSLCESLRVNTSTQRSVTNTLNGEMEGKHWGKKCSASLVGIKMYVPLIRRRQMWTISETNRGEICPGSHLALATHRYSVLCHSLVL